MNHSYIRPLEPNDFPNWLPLWDENNMGQRNEPVTTKTWSRLMDDKSPVHGLCAIKGGEMAGILHYITHLTTGAIQPACYMQDVFVTPEFRGHGVARALVEALREIAAEHKYSRLYWFADNKNEPAQALYRKLGVKLDFALHIMPLS